MTPTGKPVESFENYPSSILIQSDEPVEALTIAYANQMKEYSSLVRPFFDDIFTVLMKELPSNPYEFLIKLLSQRKPEFTLS